MSNHSADLILSHQARIERLEQGQARIEQNLARIEQSQIDQDRRMDNIEQSIRELRNKVDKIINLEWAILATIISGIIVAIIKII